ncbi:hypothetical protein HPB48_026354 [Haemaphysalis longicornis]|uniref:Uncharacterized protein n=1 Tax=Haemaphysalis longicornis TaxID=44386 RepID=A0A9J6H9E0_HAELO|nr:hypothetical protein HPB48_026354 [Haemaphysalis longicornis]
MQFDFAAPGAPAKVVLLPPMVDQPSRWGELALGIIGPEAWNSKPLGFHLRWEPVEEGQMAERGFTFPYLVSGTTPPNYDLNVTLSLSPGQGYTVFASARGLGDYGEVLAGPETPVKIESSHLEHAFNATLSRVDTEFCPPLLRAYTEYEIILKPLYVLNGTVIDTEKLGKPARMHVRTPAAAPGAPTAIVPLPTDATSTENGQLPLTVLEPVAWNSKPFGYHLRWEPAEEEEQAGLDIAIPATAASNETKKKYDLNATLTLKPGREYTVFASARGLGDDGEVHVGPETMTTVETAPLGKCEMFETRFI